MSLKGLIYQNLADPVSHLADEPNSDADATAIKLPQPLAGHQPTNGLLSIVDGVLGVGPALHPVDQVQRHTKNKRAIDFKRTKKSKTTNNHKL